VYLLLKMLGSVGVLSLCSDLRKSFGCDQKAIQCATSSRVPSTTGKALTTAQQLSESGVEIPTKKSGQIKPPADVGTKPIQLQEGYSSKTALIGVGLDPK